jgi:hypothetical protein
MGFQLSMKGIEAFDSAFTWRNVIMVDYDASDVELILTVNIGEQLKIKLPAAADLGRTELDQQALDEDYSELRDFILSLRLRMIGLVSLLSLEITS